MIKLEYDEEKAKELFFKFKKDPILGNMSLLELFELLDVSSIMLYEPGEDIITQGKHDSCFFILISGKMEVIFNDKIIRTIDDAGNIVGEMSLISNEPRSASVRAASQVTCLSIDAGYINDTKASHQSILYYIFSQILARRLRVVNHQLSDLKFGIEC